TSSLQKYEYRMANTSSPIDYALYNYPIVQFIHIFVVTVSFPPVIIFLTQISKIALHDNCKFLFRAWSSAFFTCLIMHCAYIGCDFITGKYIPETNHDPPPRLLMFAFHGFAHAMSSTQELMLSIERAVSCAWPEEYHNTGLAMRILIAAEGMSIVPAMAYLWQISNDNIALACCITNSIDLVSLICLSSTTYYVVNKQKFIVNSSLNEKYQIKEALDITRVMLPCGVISLIMKFSSTVAAWVYALDVIDSQYMFTITGSAYFIIESLNCMICSTVVLRRHEGLRRIMQSLLWPRREAKVQDVQSAEDVREIYFDALRKEWH
ncbi:hypothetical protein PRIPAC_79072, partial [Pristionchus pacificus]|uniref:Uncharacterized protein n=1 Tax=Pristionchus pacificus TaxID=54126 RepID=A0A2A6C398_PRIPA